MTTGLRLKMLLSGRRYRIGWHRESIVSYHYFGERDSCADIYRDEIWTEEDIEAYIQTLT